MYKIIVNSILLLVSVYIIGAAQEQQQITTLQHLAVQCVAQKIKFEDERRGWLWNADEKLSSINPVISRLVADQLLRPYESNIACLKTLEGHANGVCSVHWHEDGKRLATGSRDKTVCVWDVKAGKIVSKLHGHDNWVRAVRWCPKSGLLVSGSDEGRIYVWDTQTNRICMQLQGHQGPITSLSAHLNGDLIASGSEDGAVRIWDVREGTVTPIHFDDWVCSVDWHPTQDVLAIGFSNETAKLWNKHEHRICAQLDDGSYGSIQSVAWHQDGDLVALGALNGAVRIWNVREHRVQYDLACHMEPVTSVSWSLDGSVLASGSQDGTICIWNVKRKELIAQFKGHRGAVNAVSWHKDGALLASGSQDKTIRIWDIQGYDRFVDSLTITQALSVIRCIEHNADVGSEYLDDYVHLGSDDCITRGLLSFGS